MVNAALDALLFDVDGTLADTEDFHRQAFNAAFADAGRHDDLGGAAVGVFIFVCATRSAMVSSRSCPIPVKIGNGNWAIWLPNSYPSKQSKSSAATPPRIITRRSKLRRTLFTLLMH